MQRPQKITFGELRDEGVRGVLVYFADYRCCHWTKLSADRWPDHVRLSDIERRFVCEVCGKRGGGVRQMRSKIAIVRPPSSLAKFVINGSREKARSIVPEHPFDGNLAQLGR